MNNALLNLVLTQLRQFVREPQILFWSFGFPLLLVWLLGASFSDTKIKEHALGIVLPAGDIAAQRELREWGERLQGGEHELSAVANREDVVRAYLISAKYKVRYYPSHDAVLLGLKRGEIKIFFERQPDTGKGLYHLDPQDSEALLSYFALDDQGQGVRPVTEKNLVVLEGPGLRYVDWLVPGLVAMAIMETCLIAVGWTLIEKRATRVTRQLRITPMRKHDFLLAQILACFAFCFVEIVAIYLFARSYFGVHLEGGIAPFLALIVAGNLCFSGIAILAAARALKAQTASGMLEITMLFLVLFSGVFFNYSAFPEWMIGAIKWLPLTILVDAMRAVFMEGSGLLDIARPTLILTAIGLVAFGAGMRVFRWY